MSAMPKPGASAQEWAVAYLARGFSVVPVAAREKRPAIAWRAFEKKAAPRDVVVDWFEGPRAAHGVGIITGAVSGNIFVLDVDVGPGKDGADTLRALQLRHDDLPETPEVRTGGGGRHLYFRAPPGVLVKTGTNILGPGVDVRGEGGFVVAPPSVHPSGERYVWVWQYTLDDLAIADAPAWLLDLVRADAPTTRPAQITTASTSTSTGALGVMPPKIEDGREQYLRDTVRAVFAQITGENGAWPTAEELFTACAPQIERRVDLSREGRIGPTTWRDELMAKSRAIVTKAKNGALGTLEDAVAEYEARRGADRAHGPENGPHDLPAGDWRRDLVRAPNGRAYFNIANAITVLRHHDDVAGLLAFDEFADSRLVMRAVPGSRRVAGEYPRELDDDDLADLAAWFARNGFPLASKTTVADAVGVIVRESVVHPVRHWLDALAWDGVARLDRWLTDYLGAADTEFVRHVGASWLISAVARVMRPGCKADGVLILEGQQGIGKSTALRVLAGDWFGDALPPMASKDASSYLRGAWIIELSELSAMSRADVESIKAFLSRSEERFRPAYGRYEITVPRQCIFAGTTNQSSYLHDATGNRRFWPVTVGSIDIKRLEADRDQLLAEAVAAYRAGRAWWLPADVEAIARVEQADRVAEDVWTQDIRAFVDGRDAVAVRDVATQAIGLNISNVGRVEQLRISSTLRALGFERRGVFTAGPTKGSARFVRIAASAVAQPAETEF
jgi:predicted P-loop ATPase